MHKPLPKLTPAQIASFCRNLKIVGECWEWQGACIEGYGIIYFGRRYFYAHRIAFYLGKGVDPGEKLACHHCDNPPCCRPLHLFAGTVVDNAHDASRKGRLKDRGNARLGSTNHQAKLTEAEAIVIKHSTEPNVVLAERFGISNVIVGRIKSGKRWPHLSSLRPVDSTAH